MAELTPADKKDAVNQTSIESPELVDEHTQTMAVVLAEEASGVPLDPALQPPPSKSRASDYCDRATSPLNTRAQKFQELERITGHIIIHKFITTASTADNIGIRAGAGDRDSKIVEFHRLSETFPLSLASLPSFQTTTVEFTQNQVISTVQTHTATEQRKRKPKPDDRQGSGKRAQSENRGPMPTTATESSKNDQAQGSEGLSPRRSAFEGIPIPKPEKTIREESLNLEDEIIEQRATSPVHQPPGLVAEAVQPLSPSTAIPEEKTVAVNVGGSFQETPAVPITKEVRSEQLGSIPSSDPDCPGASSREHHEQPKEDPCDKIVAKLSQERRMSQKMPTNEEEMSSITILGNDDEDSCDGSDVEDLVDSVSISSHSHRNTAVKFQTTMAHTRPEPVNKSVAAQTDERSFVRSQSHLRQVTASKASAGALSTGDGGGDAESDADVIDIKLQVEKVDLRVRIGGGRKRLQTPQALSISSTSNLNRNRLLGDGGNISIDLLELRGKGLRPQQRVKETPIRKNSTEKSRQDS